MEIERASIETIARGVACVDGAVLLCRSVGASRTYLPGGHVEFGESARASLAREIREELGMGCTVGAFLGAVEHTFTQKGRPHCEINLVFAFSAPGLRADARIPSCEDHIEFSWARLNGLDAAGLEPYPMRALIPQWLAADADSRFASTFQPERSASSG